MVKILKFLNAKDWAFILLGTIFIVLQVWFDLKIPDYMAEITRLVQTKGSKPGDLWQAGTFMMLCTLGSLITVIIVGFMAARIAASLSKRLRADLFRQVESFSMEEMNRFGVASLITRSTNDITQVQTIVAMGLQILIKAPILAVWAMVKISGQSWQWSTVTGVAILVLFVMIGVIVVFALPKFRKIQSLTDNLNRVTRENLTGLRVVRAYNAEHYQSIKFELANRDLTDTNLYTSRLMAIMMPGMNLIMNGLNLAIIWIGAYLIDTIAMPGKISLFGDMIVFSSYAMQIVMAFMMLSMIFIMLPRAIVSAKRIFEVMETKPAIVDGDSDGSSESAGDIEFRNVSFKYPDAKEPVLRNISFKARRGERIAIIGATGSGKSTLINLIPRFYDVTEGEVLVGGINVKQYALHELRNKQGYVSQRAVIFSGSVESNIAYGNNGNGPINTDQLDRAVESAQAKDFVEKMAGGYEAAVSQGGTNLSGGQKQRLAIARAIARRPAIFLFDDSFSALDYRTDRILRAALKQVASEATMLIVAQRIGTVKDADRIIVLDEGQIAGIGTHLELLQTCDVYRQIAYSQLSKEELAIG